MIKVENLSYGFPEKDLYKDISFTIEDGQHCVLIGSNGTGKTTLADMLLNDDKYMYDGKIIRKIEGRYGYTSQFDKLEKERDMSVFDYLAEDFVSLRQEMEDVCKEMEHAEEIEPLMERYQQILDESLSMDADNYEINIRKELKIAGLRNLEELQLSAISGGEYKLLQIIRQMLRRPSILILDEPDVFLDFENLNGLKELLNSYRGTILAITHNRYLLHHCFRKILHLENCDIQEFEGNFIEYRFYILAQKVELQEQAAKEQAEIERNEKIVEKLRNNATRVTSASRGKALHARVSYLERLEARRIKAPFVNLRQPCITLPMMPEAEEEKTLLRVQEYAITYEEDLLRNVSFELREGEKVAIVGPNGTGKTTLLRDIYGQKNPHISVAEETEVGFLSQIHGEMLDENHTVCEEMEEVCSDRAQMKEYLERYCLDGDMEEKKVAVLSGGEKNLLQLAKIAAGNANLLLLDEPTSHLDVYAQIALEQAIADYKGTVLMVSHDFYTIANCMDYVLFVEDGTLRKMRIRSFRKKIYENHFNKDYLELEQKKKELETRIEALLLRNDYVKAKEICEELEVLVEKMSRTIS